MKKLDLAIRAERDAAPQMQGRSRQSAIRPQGGVSSERGGNPEETAA
jgi:hypothetical protein